MKFVTAAVMPFWSLQEINKMAWFIGYLIFIPEITPKSKRITDNNTITVVIRSYPLFVILMGTFWAPNSIKGILLNYSTASAELDTQNANRIQNLFQRRNICNHNDSNKEGLWDNIHMGILYPLRRKRSGPQGCPDKDLL